MSEQLSYLAGFIDGEGSISVGLNRTNKGVRRWYLRLSVHQLDPRPLRLLAETFGGSVRKHGYEARRTRQIYEWAVSSKQAAVAISAIRPYLIVKADEADVALEFQEIISKAPAGRRPHLTPLQEEERNSLYLKLRELKQRSYDEPE